MKRVYLPLAMVFMAWSSQAWAHHALYGRTPVTLLEGFLSGLAHPVIEPLHFVAVIAVGVLCGLRGKPYSGVAAFVIGGFLATWATGAAASGLMLELAVAISVFVLGLSVLIQLPAQRFTLVAGLFLIGAVHGAAYAEAILGAGMVPLVAYLVGLTLVQGAIAGAIAFLAGRLREKQPLRPIAGVILSGVGALAAVAVLAA